MASKAETKHKKQKAKLEGTSSPTPITPFVQPPSQKQIWLSKCQRAGFHCVLKNSVLLFGYTDEEKKREVLDFLGVRMKKAERGEVYDTTTLPPFSFGFCSPKLIGGSQADAVEEVPSEYEETDEETIDEE